MPSIRALQQSHQQRRLAAGTPLRTDLRLPGMVRPAVTLAAALVCCIGSVQAVGNGPYLGGITFVSACRPLMAGSGVFAC